MEINHTTLSVVVPARNSRETLGPVLTAISPELLEGDELIVVDDGSSDGTARLALSMKTRVVSNSGRPGAAGARNAGAREASGDWVLFVDSDAVAPPGWRRKLQKATGQGAQAVQATYSPVAVGNDAATFYKNFYYFYTFTSRIKRRHITGCGTFFFAVQRELFMELGGFDDRIPGATVEDADFAARLTGAGGRILMDPSIEVLHLRRYGFFRLMYYEWGMMRSKALYLLRRGSDHGVPSVSMARPMEMLPVISGALGVWLMTAGLAVLAAGGRWGMWALAAGALTVLAGHAGFWWRSVRQGGWRGFRAIWITLPDLALILPAAIAGAVLHMMGRRY